MKIKSDGYILVLTLLVISMLVIVVSSMFYNQTGHSALTATIVNREKAKMLALSGVQLAISKLVIIPKPDFAKATPGTKEEKNKKETKENKELNFLKRILPIINNFQTVTLKDDIDGLEGQISFCISCENGKININNFYDFGKHKFIGQDKFDGQKFMKEFFSRIRQITSGKDLFGSFSNFLQKRKFGLNDVTELLSIPDFEYFQNYVFYEPQNSNELKRPIFLTDIFTIWSDSLKLQPWLLSNSVINILGLKQSDVTDNEKREKMLSQIVANFKTNINWKTDWDKILKPLYGKEFGTLIPGMEILFETQFSPKFFSVVSYGTVGEVTQKVYAILEIENDEAIAKLKKLYWI